MKTEHSGIEITYNEVKDRWEFELRGRSRSADSLAKAKEAINKEPVEKRKQAFPRFDAYLNRYQNGWGVVSVTSVADAGYRSGEYFWISNAQRGREKESASSLFPVNEHNTRIVDEIKRFESQIETCQEQVSKLIGKLQMATVPKEIA